MNAIKSWFNSTSWHRYNQRHQKPMFAKQAGPRTSTFPSAVLSARTTASKIRSHQAPPKNGDLRGCHWPAHSEGSVNTSRNLLSSFYPVINKDWLGIIWRHPHYPSFMDMHPFWIVINNLGKFGRTCGATSQIMPTQHTPYCAPQNQTLGLDFEILYQSDSV